MKIISAFVFLVIMFLPVYGQEIEIPAETQAKLPAESPSKSSYGFSAGAQFGFIYGQSFELVYPVHTKGKLLSELIWDMKPVIYSGIKIEFEKTDIMSAPGFFFSFSFKAGIPLASGIMEDRDWQSIENGLLTNFSSHNNKTQGLFTADLYAGASLPVKSLFYIKPFLSGSWMHFSFSAADGYLQYAEKINNGIYGPIEEAEKKPCYGEVITYRQDWLLLSAGLMIGTNILHPFTVNLSFQISPLAYCAATDKHLMSNVTYKDFTYFGIYLEPAINVSLVFNSVELSFNFAYRHIEKAKGKTYFRGVSEEKYSKSPNASGAEVSLFDTCFLITVHF